MTKIRVKGVSYNLNMKSALKCGVLTPTKTAKERSFRNIGQIYYGPDDELYCLACVDVERNVCGLIHLVDGVIYDQGIVVNNINNITESEWKKITSNERGFRLTVENITTILIDDNQSLD